MIKIKRLTADAKLPSMSNPNDAGLDLHTTVSADIAPMCRAKLTTGLAIALPVGTVGLIWPRSKLANEWGLGVLGDVVDCDHRLGILGGVVDCDYRGEVMISVINHGHDTIELRAGDKVAQMIIQEHKSGMEITEVRNLDDTERGTSGINDTELRLK